MINFATNTKDAFNSPEALTVREAGLSVDPLPPVDQNDREQLPPNRAQWPVPQHLGFSASVGIAQRAHYHTVDEALRHSRQNADAMLKDILIVTALEDRIQPAAQLSWHIEPEDETDNAQMKAAAKNTLAVSKTWKLQEFYHQLHLAKWYGKYGLELLWRWDDYQPDLCKVANWTPVNGDSIALRWAYDGVGRLVSPLYEGPTEPYSLGRVHWYTQEELESFVYHTHRPRQPDFYDGLSSGQLRGTGLRHACYWIWYYRANLLSLLMDYSERLSQGIWKGWYQESNPEARADLERAVAAYKQKSLLSLPMRPDGSKVADLAIMEVGGASSAILKDTIAYLDRLLRSYILGRPVPEGNIGGDEVALHEDGISGTTKSDANSLAEDLTANWLPTLYKYNSPGVPTGRFVFDTDHPNADRLLQYAQILRDMNFAVDLDHLAKVCGLPKASLNSNISTKVQPLNPVAVQDAPLDTPIAGTSPPAQSSPAATAATSIPSGVSA